MPACLGDYKADEICDGKQTEPPCIFRDRCVAFKKHLSDSGESAASSLEQVEVEGQVYSVAKAGDGSFRHKLAILVDRYGVYSGIVSISRPKPIKLRKRKRKVLTPDEWDARQRARASKPKKQRRPVQARQEAFDACLEQFRHFVQLFSERLQFRVHESFCFGAVFYLVNRVGSSRYASIYCTTEKSNKHPVVRVMFCPRVSGLRYMLPFSLVDLRGLGVSKAQIARLGITKCRDGRFLVKTGILGRHAASGVVDILYTAMTSEDNLIPFEGDWWPA